MNEDYIYLFIILFSVLLIAYAFLFVSFFLVRLYGVFEEGDEEYDLCHIGKISYQNGEWVIDADNLFDDNAAIKIKFGFIFKLLFYDSSVCVNSNGVKNGTAYCNVGDALVFRRKIRKKW